MGFVRVVLAGALLGVAATAAPIALALLLPRDGEVSRGVRLDGQAIALRESARAVAEEHAKQLLARRVTLTREGKPLLEASLGELGATVDVEDAVRRAESIGREGGLFAKLDQALEARRGHLDVPLRVELPADEVAARLEHFKEELDAAPVAAKLLIDTHAATPHTAGKYLDVYAAARAIERALASDVPRLEASIDAPLFEIAPKASSEAVLQIDVARVLSRYETHFGFVGGQANRGNNVKRAAAQMNGVVLMPGETVSFNQNVGPRSIENGFATAPEIFKGELREGIGGGTCQVAGTLHAAAFFGGVDIVERANHSRPSSYIPLGLDATVVYPTTDLKLKNPYDFPVVVHATIDQGTLVFELRGKEAPVTVAYSMETVGAVDFKRKIEEAPYLAEGVFKLKQKGHRGVSIKKTRLIKARAGGERVEVTTDTYPPTFEIWQVGPNTDADKVLPVFDQSGVKPADPNAPKPSAA